MPPTHAEARGATTSIFSLDLSTSRIDDAIVDTGHCLRGTPGCSTTKISRLRIVGTKEILFGGAAVGLRAGAPFVLPAGIVHRSFDEKGGVVPSTSTSTGRPGDGRGGGRTVRVLRWGSASPILKRSCKSTGSIGATRHPARAWPKLPPGAEGCERDTRVPSPAGAGLPPRGFQIATRLDHARSLAADREDITSALQRLASPTRAVLAACSGEPSASPPPSCATSLAPMEACLSSHVVIGLPLLVAPRTDERRSAIEPDRG